MKNQGFINYSTQGNAFIIILITIALLAALTATVTRMGNTSNEISVEQAQTGANAIIKMAQSMVSAVDNLRAKGCSITQLNFENNVDGYYINAQAPADKSCNVFDIAGAGMAWPVAPPNTNDGSWWSFMTRVSVAGVGPERETGVACTTNCADLIMALPGLKLEICQAINLIAGVTTSLSATPPKDANAFVTYYRYRAASAATTNDNFSSANTGTGTFLQTTGTPLRTTALFDKKMGCFEASGGYTDLNPTAFSGTGVYIFYQVLVER